MIAVAIGWVDSLSMAFATVRRWSRGTDRFSIDWMENTPSVRVPVLSSATVSSFFRRWIASSPFTRIPFFAKAPMDAKYVSGTESTRAQGHDITSSIAAL